MKAKIIHKKCSGGDCPTIYETDRNTFIIQGYKLANEEKAILRVGENEDIIEIPMEFLKSFIDENSK